jgi:hypothetical protein
MPQVMHHVRAQAATLQALTKDRKLGSGTAAVCHSLQAQDGWHAGAVSELRATLAKRDAEVEYLQGTLEAAIMSQHRVEHSMDVRESDTVSAVKAELRELKSAAVRYAMSRLVT